MSSFPQRLYGALTLQAKTFEEVEHDSRATPQAAAVVLLAAVSTGASVVGLFGLRGMIRQTLIAVVAWAVSAAVIWVIGTKILPGRRTEGGVGQLLRTLGFAHAPIVCSVLVAVPLVGWIVRLVLWPWALLAIVVAVRQALDYEETLRALLVCLIAWAAWMAVSMAGALVGLGPAVR